MKTRQEKCGIIALLEVSSNTLLEIRNTSFKIKSVDVIICFFNYFMAIVVQAWII